LCSRVFILPSWLDLQLAQNAKILFSGPYDRESRRRLLGSIGKI
jgi:hypothetical protein